jgi:hypothetical protein
LAAGLVADFCEYGAVEQAVIPDARARTIKPGFKIAFIASPSRVR